MGVIDDEPSSCIESSVFYKRWDGKSVLAFALIASFELGENMSTRLSGSSSGAITKIRNYFLSAKV